MGMGGPIVHEFSDSGMEVTAGPSKVTLQWDAILEVAETKEFFLFFISKRWAH
jgi:hypothetical protein